MKNWLINDWKHNRFRLFCETIGSLCFISIYVLLAWYGDSASILIVFMIQLVGSSLHIINAYLSCLLYTSPSPRDRTRSRMPSSA